MLRTREARLTLKVDEESRCVFRGANKIFLLAEFFMFRVQGMKFS